MIGARGTAIVPDKREFALIRSKSATACRNVQTILAKVEAAEDLDTSEIVRLFQSRRR